MANDRHEEAIAVMARYHGEGDRDSPIVQLEFREMMEDISITGSDKRWWDYRELFNSKEVRYRSMLVVAMGKLFRSLFPMNSRLIPSKGFFGQWSGNGPVSYYYPQMLAGAGVSSNHTQLLLQGLQNVVSFIGAITGAMFTDKWGRRPQLLVSVGCLVVIFVLITALNATNIITDATGNQAAKSPQQAKAEIAIIFIFGFVFAAGFTPLQALYPVECLQYQSRAKGMGMYNFWVNIAGFYNTFVTGIAFTGAGWKYYFLFIFWDIFEFGFIYWFFVETKNRTVSQGPSFRYRKLRRRLDCRFTCIQPSSLKNSRRSSKLRSQLPNPSTRPRLSSTGTKASRRFWTRNLQLNESGGLLSVVLISSTLDHTAWYHRILYHR